MTWCSPWCPADRNNELCKLRKSHVQDQIRYNEHKLPYFTVTLENRKGWQKKVGYEGDLIGEWVRQAVISHGIRSDH